MLRPATTFLRLAFGIVAGFLALHVAWLLYYGHERMVETAATFARAVAERALSLRDLQSRYGEEHPELLALLQTPVFELQLTAAPPTPPRRMWPHNDEVREGVRQRLGELGYHGPFSFWYGAERGHPKLTFSLPLAGGRHLTIRAASDAAASGHRVMALVWTTAMLLLALLAVLLATRRVTRLLPALASAAERVGGRGGASELPEDRGPTELRRVSRAFNDMQRRVQGLLEERSDMLGAISHDLRTLAARLQLRTDYIEDEQERLKALADLEAMTTILAEALAYVREERSDEPCQLCDLTALLRGVVEDEAALGGDASLRGAPRLEVSGQPVALRRAFTNLVRNAVQYGGAARVELTPAGLIRVNDSGPGMDPGDLELMTRPYRRGEASRSRATGGTGLGLAIARRVIERHRGRLWFERPDEGDFAVVVDLGRAVAEAGRASAGAPAARRSS